MQREIIAGRLRAYCPATSVADAYDALSEGVTDLYVLTGVYDPKYRAEHVIKMRWFFGDATTDWAKLESLELRKTDFLAWFRTWWDIREACRSRKDAVILAVLSARLNLGA